MAGIVSSLVAQVLAEGQFDAPEDTALRWLNARHRTMVADARCYVAFASIGPVVEGQPVYDYPATVLEIERVARGGFTGEKGLDKIDYEDGLAGRASGWATFQTGFIRLFPAPTAADDGDTLVVRGKSAPPDLDPDDDTTLKVPVAYYDSLVSAAIATGLARWEQRPDLAQPGEGQFATDVQKLRRDTARRDRGYGPAKIRVQR